jgi:outer membrane protein TolC
VIKILRLVVIIGLLETAATASAQNPYKDPVLDSLIAVALHNNPGLKASEKNAESMDYRVTPSGILPDPMFMLSLSGPTRGSWVGEPMSSPNVMVGLNQMIPFPGKQAAMKKAARYMALGTKEMTNDFRLGLAAGVKSAYYELAYWQSALQTVERNIRYIDELEQVARERYKVGIGLQTNVLNAQKTRTQLEDHKLMVMQMLQTAELTLVRLLGGNNVAGIQASLPGSPDLPEQDPSLLNSRMTENNPGLKMAEFQVLSGKQMTRKAGLDFMPDLSIGAAYGFGNGNEMDPMFSEDMLTFTIGLNLPIWAGWKQKNELSSARASLKSSEYEYEDMINRLRFQLSKSVLEYDRNRSRYILYSESLLPQTEAVLESARASYEVGQLEFLDVIMAQMELFDAQLERQRSLADALKTLAEIEMLTAASGNQN